jgi:hypothetical protein
LCGNNRERHEKEGRKEEKIFFSEIFEFFESWTNGVQPSEYHGAHQRG